MAGGGGPVSCSLSFSSLESRFGPVTYPVSNWRFDRNTPCRFQLPGRNHHHATTQGHCTAPGQQWERESSPIIRPLYRPTGHSSPSTRSLREISSSQGRRSVTVYLAKL